MRQFIQLFVNGHSLDLPDPKDDPLQLVFQSNDLGDITSINTNVSKTLTIPLTRRNKIILGFPDDLTIISSAPYDFYAAKLVCDGLEIIPKGKLQIDHCDNDTAEICITSGNADFCDLLGYSVADMGDSTSPASGYGNNLIWAQFEHPWSVASAAGSQEKTNGWKYPVVGYGTLSIQSDGSQYNLFDDVVNMRPAFFLQTALETVVQSTGYTIDKNSSWLYSSPKYYNLFSRILIPWSNSSFEHGVDFSNTPSQLSVDDNILSKPFIVIQGHNYAGRVPFNMPQIGPFADNIEGTFTVNFSLTLQGISIGSNPSAVQLNIDIYTPLPGGGFSSATTLASQVCELIDGDGATQIGDYAGVPVLQKQFTGTISAQSQVLVPGAYVIVNYFVHNSPVTTWAMDSKSSFSFDVSNQDVLFGQQVQCEKILPDIGQLDLVKLVLRIFGLILIANPVAGTVRFISFDQVVANKPIAKNWSDKCLDMGKQVNYNLGNYAQQNWLRYADDGAIPRTRMPRFFADDVILVNDKTLSPNAPVQDLYDAVFAPSLNTTIFGQYTAQIADPTATDDFGVGDQPRILIDQIVDLRTLGANPDGSMKSVTFGDAAAGYENNETKVVINSKVSLPYFYKPNGDQSLDPAPRHLCWNDKGGMPGLKSSYYSVFEQMLTQTKKLVLYFNLTSRDIAELDVSIPIYLRQYSGYYYLNKVDSWTPKKPVKVELIKI